MRLNSPTLFLTLILLTYPTTSRASRTESPPVSTEVGPPILLGEGEQKLLHFPQLLRFSIGQPIARALPLPKAVSRSPKVSLKLEGALLLKGIKPGATDLWVWKKDGSAEIRTLRVVRWKKSSLPSGLLQSTQLLREVEVLWAGPGVLLRGPIFSKREAAAVSALARNYPKRVGNETYADSSLLHHVLSELQTWSDRLPKSESKSIHFNIRGHQIWVTGSIPNEKLRKSLEEQILSIFPITKVDLKTLGDSAKTILFRVYLVELKRDQLQSFGIQWPDGQENAIQLTTSRIFEEIQLDLALKAAAGAGNAKILSAPEIAVRAPGNAELFAGGEIPIRNRGRFYSNVAWRSYGLSLKLTIEKATSEQVRLEIQTEVSHLDYSTVSDEVPGLRLNRMKTQVDAKLGQPLFLCGLLQEKTREQSKGLPLLKNLPILGALFGSKDYQNEKSELVAILMPEKKLPRIPVKAIEAYFPRGPIPPLRNWTSPSEQAALRSHPDFPWNVLE